jgi:hypothetical protein
MFITHCSKKIFIIKTVHNEFETNNTFNPGRGLQEACVCADENSDVPEIKRRFETNSSRIDSEEFEFRMM